MPNVLAIRRHTLKIFYASTKFWDLFAVLQRIPTYSSVFVTCLKLISNVFSVHQRTCLISHTSAYVGVNVPKRMHNLPAAYI